jgi:hypothetical protein
VKYFFKLGNLLQGRTGYLGSENLQVAHDNKIFSREVAKATHKNIERLKIVI